MTNLNTYTLEEVANILKVTRRTIYNYIKNGDLKAVKMGKYWRVSEANLQDFIEHGTKKKGQEKTFITSQLKYFYFWKLVLAEVETHKKQKGN